MPYERVHFVRYPPGVYYHRPIPVHVLILIIRAKGFMITYLGSPVAFSIEEKKLVYLVYPGSYPDTGEGFACGSTSYAAAITATRYHTHLHITKIFILVEPKFGIDPNTIPARHTSLKIWQTNEEKRTNGDVFHTSGVLHGSGHSSHDGSGRAGCLRRPHLIRSDK